MESEMCNLSEMWSKKMPKGLELEISHKPPSMRHVANLIIAIERLKAGMPEIVLSTDFRDENLINIMLESIIEEKFILETFSAPPDFRRGVEHVCSVRDTQQRSLILVEDIMELQAVMLPGGSENLKSKVFLNMTTYARPPPSTEAQPVTLGIKNTNLYLSCRKKDGTPTLYLEEVKNKSSLEKISSESEMQRFLFYKQDTAVNISTLMSAYFPNWYISTSTVDKKPVEMCQESDTRYRTFKIQSTI